MALPIVPFVQTGVARGIQQAFGEVAKSALVAAAYGGWRWARRHQPEVWEQTRNVTASVGVRTSIL